MHSPSPCAIGWPRLITQMRSRSPASRHFSEQGVPISLRKIFEKWPECSTISPMPSQTRFCTRSTMASLTLPWRSGPTTAAHRSWRAAPRSARARAVQRRGFKRNVLGAVKGLGNGAMDSLRVEFGHKRIGFFVLVFVPDQGADRHRCGLSHGR